MEKDIKLSIVTAYYNRKELFKKTLDSIKLSGHTSDIEVIVVDDASREDQRLEDLVDKYPFPIKIIRLEKEDKYYVNPCVPFNWGFNHIQGDIVLIQNPECVHVGNVIDHALANITKDNYIAYSTYALSPEQTLDIDNLTAYDLKNKPSSGNQEEGWYNHSKINRRPLHFASCITADNLHRLGGFDEAYAYGVGFDDNEFLLRVRKILRVDICDQPFVLHQNHYNEASFEDAARKDSELLIRNRDLYAANAPKTKIVGFSQLRNELELGNLENWFRCMEICDEIYIFDQNSTDGSREFYEKFDNVHVIYSDTNRFSEELICKQELLDKLLEEQPDTDWIFWLDGDTLLDNRLLEKDVIRQVLFKATHLGLDSIILGHYNLWRSERWHRVDDQYDHFMQAGRMAFWRNNKNLSFANTQGLHQNQHPLGIETAMRIPFNLIHRGFATDKQILTKYNNYKSRGQTGWALDRLLNEEGIQLEQVPADQIPHWISLDSESPTEKKRLIDIYNDKEKHRDHISNL